MNSHKQQHDILDLSFNRSLKNWVARKGLPVQGRDRLLAAAAQQEISTTQQKYKYPKLNFGWTFRFQESLEALSARPVYGFSMESAYSLRANMAII